MNPSTHASKPLNPWPKPDPGDTRLRYVFAQYTDGYDSNQFVPLRELSPLKWEFYRQIYSRFGTWLSGFRHAAIVVFTDNDMDDEWPSESKWEGVFWNWSRNRISSTADPNIRRIDPSGRAKFSDTKVWNQALGSARRYDFHGMTYMSNDEIVNRSK